jgi:hypothetical protein
MTKDICSHSELLKEVLHHVPYYMNLPAFTPSNQFMIKEGSAGEKETSEIYQAKRCR